MTQSIAVYSCYFGNPEPFNASATGDGDRYDRILFTDRDDLRPDGMRVVRTSSVALGATYESRRAKILPHQCLPDYDWVFYVDNRAALKKNPRDVIDLIKRSHGPDPAGRYLFRHPERDSVRDELDVCLKMGLISETQWKELLELYMRIGFSSPDLTHNAIIICKQGDSETEKVSQMWFELFLRYCRRDQLVLQPAEHIVGKMAQRLDFALTDIADWPVYSDLERTDSYRPVFFAERPPLLSIEGLRYRTRRRRIRKLVRNMAKVARDR